jgi:hypothetical protein
MMYERKRPVMDMAQRSLKATADPIGINANRTDTTVVTATDHTGIAVVGET